MLRSKRAAGLVTLALLTIAAPSAFADLSDLKGTQPGTLNNGGFFTDGDTCRNCHGGGYMGDTTYLPHDTWAGTMMGNAVRDPVFQAALSIAAQASPAAATQLCVRCHSPIGFVRGHADPPDLSALDAIDNQGVGCDACHRMNQAPPPDDPYYLGDAQVTFDDNTAKHGKYSDSTSPAHEMAPDLGVLDSRFCGQCHQVFNPTKHLLDETGSDTGLDFPFETTFEEWQNSAFSVSGGADEATCVDCHMVKKVGDWPLVKNNLAAPRKDPRAHTFVGGNHWGIQAVMEAYPDRATQYPEAFDNALKSTLDSLASAVALAVSAPPASLSPGEAFDLTIKVENKTGHKFPTGYVDARQAWIAVTFVDCNGTERTVLGGYDETTGAIQQSPATHVYHSVHGRWDGSQGVPEHDMLAQEMHLEDTRIPPKGFAPSVATMPAGPIDYADGNGGYEHWDEATFSMTAPADAAGAQTLSVRVYYQSMRRDFAEFLRDNTPNQTGSALWDIYAKTQQAPPLVIASAESDVTFPGECVPNTGGGGAGGGTGGNGTGGNGTGNEGTGGAGATGASGPGASDASPGDDGGCGCRTTAPDVDPRGLAAVAAIALAAIARRRRR